jgi:hypothetical protein
MVFFMRNRIGFVFVDWLGSEPLRVPLTIREVGSSRVIRLFDLGAVKGME